MYEKKRLIIQYDDGKEEIGKWEGCWKPEIFAVVTTQKQRLDCPYVFWASYNTSTGDFSANDEEQRKKLIKMLQNEIDELIKLIHDLQEE